MDKRLQQIVDNLRNNNISNSSHSSATDVNNLNDLDKKKIDMQAISSANALVEHVWENKNAPLRIGSMLEALGFSVILDDSFGDGKLSGILAIVSEKDSLKKIIILNSKDNIGHQRFTIAHELAHYIFDALPNQEYYESYYRTNEETKLCEYRANKFAANLLMPESIFVPRYEYVASKISNRQMVRTILGLDFGVSPTAIERRTKELRLGVE